MLTFYPGLAPLLLSGHKGAEMCDWEISETSTKISAIFDILKISDILFYVADILNIN